MKPSFKLFPLLLCTVAVAVAGAAEVKKSTLTYLGLPRLKTTGKSTEARLAATKFTTDRLLPQGAAGARTTVNGDAKYLAVAPGADWSRPLRGSPRDVTFVSFLAYGSAGTRFEVGGATLTIKSAPKPDYAQVVVSSLAGGAALLDYSVKIERHKGAALAALPVFTVRLDPVAGVWALYSFERLLAEDLPLAAGNGARKFSVHAGKEGAAICGLVFSDENPLFVDANANGVDDPFEKAHRNGVLLPANATPADRKQVLLAWQNSQQASKSSVWPIARPAPDRTP